MTNAQKSIAGFLALRSYVALEAIALIDKYDTHIISDDQWACQRDLENQLWGLGNAMVTVEKPAKGFFHLDFTEGATPDTLTIDIDGVEAVNISLTGDVDTLRDDIITQIEAHFTSEGVDGRTFRVGGDFYVYGPPAWNTFEITWDATGGSTDTTTELTLIENFAGGAEVGEFVSYCDDCCHIEKLLNSLTSGFQKSDCCHDQFELIPELSLCCDCNSDGTLVPDATIPFAALTLTDNGSTFDISALGSLDCVQNAINPADVSGDYTFTYEFFDDFLDTNPVYKLSILPGSDASLSGSWTYISGTEIEAHFQANLLPALTGTGHDFTIDMNTQTALNNGEIKVRMTVNDSDCGDSVPVSKQSSITLPPPVALFSYAIPPYNIGTPGQQQVTFDGTISTNNDGNPTSSLIFYWDWDDTTTSGPTVGFSTPNHSFPNGTYNVSLTVTDSNGASDTYSEQIVISLLPFAAQGTPDTSDVAYPIMDGAPSFAHDSDGEEDFYQWAAVNPDDGKYISTFTGFRIPTALIEEQEWISGTSLNPVIDLPYLHSIVCVGAPNASFTYTPQNPIPGGFSDALIDFNSAGTNIGGCQDPGTMTYAWTFYDVDGVTILSTSAAENPSYQFPVVTGKYHTTLKVTNNCGVATIHKEVDIQVPVIFVSFNKTNTTANTYDFTSEAVVNGFPGGITAHDWKIYDIDDTTLLYNVTTANITYAFPDPAVGTYRVVYTITVGGSNYSYEEGLAFGVGDPCTLVSLPANINEIASGFNISDNGDGTVKIVWTGV